jgi:hypothetical protein
MRDADVWVRDRRQIFSVEVGVKWFKSNKEGVEEEAKCSKTLRTH